MKWSSSSNSSLSSSAGLTVNGSGGSGSNCNTNHSGSVQNGGLRSNASDRRSIFYTDSTDIDIMKSFNNNNKMSPINRAPPPPPQAAVTPEVNVRLQVAEEALEVQQRKCENLISYFSTQIHNLTEELENEKRWRDTHLAKIVKALLCFEAKLKNDQKHIRQQLYEKDTQLNRLSREIIAMREKYGVECNDEIKTDAVAQYCPNCRKQYYHLDTKDASVQVAKHELGCGAATEKDLTKNQTTSSDDGLNSVFSSEARRSKRYMSKRTSGTFREYLKSRSIDLPADSETVVNDNNKQSQQSETTVKAKDTFVRGNSADVANAWKFSRSSMRRSNKSSAVGSKHEIDSKDMNGVDECNAAVATCESKVNNTKIAATSDSSFLKKYENEMTAPKTQFESTDDWYASASDMDDSDSAVSKPYGYNAVNPVLECVNQILLQQSMDGIMDNCATSMENAANGNSNTANTSTLNSASDQSPKDNNTLKKRVHFSTQNSMVQVPRSDASGSAVYQLANSIISSADIDHHNHKELSYATIYSNDYEPIGSENNSSHYVDMESKLGDDRPIIIEKSKTPPALPPKPANLMKLKQVLKIPGTSFMKQQQQILLPQSDCEIVAASSTANDLESEPDYCSISDVQEAIIKNVQIVADVHKNAEDDASSHASEETKTDVTDETFADVPKLPNVTAIISPKKEPTIGKLISQDNYIKTKSPTPSRVKLAPGTHPISIVLAEINAHKNSNSVSSSHVNKPKITNGVDDNKKNPIKLLTQCNDLMPIQAEFDWYNLDVEYGKLMPNNVQSVKDEFGRADKKDDAHNTNFGVEYNLDAEFSVSSDNNSSLESNGARHFVPITMSQGSDKSTSKSDALKKGAQKVTQSRHKVSISTMSESVEMSVKSFDSFLEQTGLTAKPLPQKRKIFYNAPFV